MRKPKAFGHRPKMTYAYILAQTSLQWILFIHNTFWTQCHMFPSGMQGGHPWVSVRPPTKNAFLTNGFWSSHKIAISRHSINMINIIIFKQFWIFLGTMWRRFTSWLWTGCCWRVWGWNWRAHMCTSIGKKACLKQMMRVTRKGLCHCHTQSLLWIWHRL